ncbi:family 16 glycoside hydrolase [Paractinoplanes atraurantiacus]|uniref:Carbohydrate binding module (Family 35) n=1 Tax=Paractinoplanes atraurantiacus TaxID=1036182 RepID=A0A285IH32_9ACTN|nr:family 16 glycoside hydrolase [Actinoplanes atraurantiacus]SNY47274.1 Carbohydrate binding module (family 35) [Actinoplanes atraurantiacus]
MKRLLVGALLVGTFAAAPAYAAADPPQEPGVTLRTYDIGTAMSRVCELNPGQTPNVDKLMPTVDWSTTDQFGLGDNFVTHALANLTVPATGQYAFRLVSDDGSKLFVGDTLLIDHDGLHDVEPPGEGTIELTAGVYPIRVEHFDRDGGQRLTLSWKTPGANDFAVVPASALSTDAGVVRVTAPGRKECTSGTDTPGDGLPLTAVNPGYDLKNLRPPGFEPQVTGIAWRPDGKMVLSTWGGSDKVAGEVYLVTGATGPGPVTYKKIAEGLKEPMGIAVVDGLVYVSQKHELTELRDTNGDQVLDARRTVAVWPFGGNFHEFAFGLLYKDGYFHLNLSVSINLGGATTDPQPVGGRGTSIVVNRKTGQVTTVAGGLRTPNGIGWGDNGSIYVTDNQGGWLPSSKLIKIEKNAFYNHYTNPDGPYDAQPVTRPVLWLPQNQIANSPSTPVLLKSGPYKGQFVIGDVTYGGLQRAYLEKVNGQEQGAVFRHTQGLEAGVNRVSLGPDGSLYLGGLGADGNWGQEGKLRFGLQKLTPNGKNVFDMKTLKATPTGFAIEYTKPLSDETIAKLPTAYGIEQWRYVPTAQYGGPEVDKETLKVTGAKVSGDRKTVTLTVEGLRRDRVVHLRSPRPFAARDGETLWSTEAWYTMNEVPGSQKQEVFYEAEEGYREGSASLATDHRGFSGIGFVAGFGNLNASTTTHVTVGKTGDYAVGLRYSNGPNPFSGTKTVSVHVNDRKVKQVSLPSTVTWDEWATATETLRLNKGVNKIQYRVDALDTGHVNLDLISVREPGQRIVLFDGKGLDNWQHTDGRRPQWPAVAGNAVEVCCGDLRTKEAFGDYKLHVEFKVPLLPPDVTGQNRGNSGVYQQERYEIQILDSYGDTTLDNNEAGAIYTVKAPDVNMATPPETWQKYDITFRAARYDADGKKTENARVTLVWNGKTVHQNVEIPNGTGGNIPEGPATGSIRLQDHGNKVQYRNVWIEPLSGGVQVG